MEFFKQIGIIERDITPLDPTPVFHIGNFPITDSTLMILLIALIFAAVSFFVIRKFSLRPNKTQSFIEMVYEESVALIQQITNSKKHAERIFPIVGAMLIYLVFANLISLIPGLEQITFDGVAIFRSPTADFNTTFGLAFGAVIAINILTVKKKGILAYLGNFFKFKEVYLGFRKSVSDGFVACINFFVGILDIIGEVAKIISLALRLFGNMYAGGVLMIILFGTLALIVPALWLAMNIFVGILQAIVFVSLVSAYYMLALGDEEEVSQE